MSNSTIAIRRASTAAATLIISLSYCAALPQATVNTLGGGSTTVGDPCGYMDGSNIAPKAGAEATGPPAGMGAAHGHGTSSSPRGHWSCASEASWGLFRLGRCVNRVCACSASFQLSLGGESSLPPRAIIDGPSRFSGALSPASSSRCSLIFVAKGGRCGGGYVFARLAPTLSYS